MILIYINILHLRGDMGLKRFFSFKWEVKNVSAN